MFQRSSGLLCHITSLPGAHGIGDMGPESYRFVDFLAGASQHLWQVLPLGPAGGGDSPYDSRSSFAGNPLMISMNDLVDLDLLPAVEVPETTGFSTGRIQFRRVEQWKGRRLRLAFEAFRETSSSELNQEFAAFLDRSVDWLHDYALYQAISEKYGGKAWYRWPDDLRSREKDAMHRAHRDLADEVLFHQFEQYLFDRQWHQLKRYANQRNVMIMGDIPIYVALDSADVWANQDQFLLEADGQPSVQAGVPPDLFAADGQLWGNPVYDWSKMEADGFSWWTQRLQRVLDLTDIVRIDHFRGFAAGWQVPRGERTARNGEWVEGPGYRFFETIAGSIGTLPIIVEDLGVITPDVEALRDGLGYPGMKVLQFAFGDDADNPYLPHNAVANSMVYTGTHDNDTTLGWYRSITRQERDHVRRYLNVEGSEIHLDFIRTAWASVSVLACAPVQDVLGLGTDARMNVPGKAKGNWGWRLDSIASLDPHQAFLQDITNLYGRNRSPVEG